jgi:hexosaminidase
MKGNRDHVLHLNLLPQPRSIEFQTDQFVVREQALMVIDSSQPAEVFFTARRVQQAMYRAYGFHWEIVAGPSVPIEQVGLTLRLNPSTSKPQGYTLTIEAHGMAVEAADPAGLFYGASTLIQILDRPQPDQALPCLRIDDWPDFSVRGAMLDISRDKVPTMETLRDLVDLLASWKINQLQLYTEHTFAYRNHPEVWAQASPMTGEEILELDRYGRERFVELVPNQNSFGHMTRWLKHPRYAALAELHGSYQVPWGIRQGPSSLCPLDPRSLELIGGLYDELLPHFTSRLFNVGCDETFDLGQGRSQEECQRVGAGRVYLDFLLKIYREVTARDHVMQFWGDIIVQSPDLIPELPRDAIALEWGYEANHPFDEHGARFARSGIPYYVCPGTSSWTTIGGRTDNALRNLLNAAVNGLKYGAGGYLNTDWGDEGHWQTLPISYLGFALGAAYAWAMEANRDVDVPHVIGWRAFHDRADVMGQLAYDLGNIYQLTGLDIPNSSPLFWALQWPIEQLSEYRDALPAATLERTIDRIDSLLPLLDRSDMRRADAELIKREFTLAASMMKHACRRAQFAFAPTSATAAILKRELQSIISEFQQVWLTRNRPGGLPDSLTRFKPALNGYLLA